MGWLAHRAAQPVETRVGEVAVGLHSRREVTRESAGDLFSQLRRFRPTPGRDPQEDPLTEALAVTFEAAPDAAAFLARAWFGRRPEGDVTVRTQRWVRKRERLDLEVLFGPVGKPDFRLWFEAKIDAPPTREQACRYLEALGELSGEGRLSWLLPVGVAVRGGSPDGVPEHTWQDLALTLNEWLGTLGSDERERYSGWLVEQFVNHLEQKKVAVTTPLDPSDVLAIDGYDLATRRVAELRRLTASRIHAHRPMVHHGKDSPAALGFFEHVEHAGTWPDTCYFEWGGTRDERRHDPAGVYAISAGVTWETAHAPGEADHRDWFGRRYDDGFELGASRWTVHLHRYRTLEELTGLPDLAAQAASLAEWALEAWKILEDDPLPR